MVAIPPQTTLNSGSCYACYGASVVEMLELSLLDSISQNIGGVVPPVDPYDGLLVYTRQGLGTTTVVGPVGAYNLTFGANKVTEIHCHNCPLITGITCTTNALLTVLDLENLPAMANLVFTGCAALTTVDLTTFTSLSGQLEFQVCSALSTFTAPNLISTGTALNLILTGMVNASFPALTSCGTFFGCSGNSLLTVSTPVLATIGENYYCANSPILTSVSSPLLTTAPTGLYFDNCSALSGLSFNSLTTTALINVPNCTSMTTLGFPSLVDVDTVVADGCTLLDTVDFQSLDMMITGMSFNSCTSLSSIDFPAYSNLLPFAIFASDCTVLTSFSFSTMIAQDGSSMGITNCALNESSVNSFIQALTDGGTTASVLDLSGGSNSAPDATHAAQVVTLNLAGNSVTTN